MSSSRETTYTTSQHDGRNGAAWELIRSHSGGTFTGRSASELMTYLKLEPHIANNTSFDLLGW